MSLIRLIVGCGYLGQRVAALWRQRGERVYATTRRPEGAEVLRRQGLEPIVCDVLDPASLRMLPAADTVVYAVGLDRGSGATMRAVYVDGLAHVLEQMPLPGRFVYVSSSSVYGQVDGGWVDETAATEPQEEAGRVVLAAEGVLRRMLSAAVVLRFAGIYGTGRLLRRKTIEAGEPIVGDEQKWLNLIHVEDGARAVLAAAEQARAGELYNICDDLPVRRRAFYAEMARRLAAPPPRFVAPPPEQPTPPHEKGNRRLANRRMKEELRVVLRYADYRQGLAASAPP
jgi:nucleoside-diphosphate-sugar epimerase